MYYASLTWMYYASLTWRVIYICISQLTMEGGLAPPRCSQSATASLWSGLARRAAATRSGAWLLGTVTSVRHSGGHRAQYVLLVLLHAPLQVAVLDEHVWLERLAGERAQ